MSTFVLSSFIACGVVCVSFYLSYNLTYHAMLKALKVDREQQRAGVREERAAYLAFRRRAAAVKAKMEGGKIRFPLNSVEDYIRDQCAIDPGIIRVFNMVSDKTPTTLTGLVFVSESTVDCGVVTLYFPATPERTVDLVLVEITPSEFDDVLAGRLFLPIGWALGDEIHVPDSRQEALV